MTWARLDDQTASNPAWVSVLDEAIKAASVEHYGASPPVIREAARVAAARAKFVHLVTLMWAVPALSDGKIGAGAVDQICAMASLTPEEWYAGADLLVASGAWKAVKASKRNPMPSHQMILGWSPGEQPTAAEDRARRAQQRLRDALRPGAKDYPARVIAVERSEGECEYCSTTISEFGQIDHVVPELLSNDVENLAHVCGSCNKKKGNHSLDAAGMAFTAAAEKRRAAYRSQPKTPREQGK